MASLNDNLFTTLVNYTIPHEFGCYLQTQWGALRVNITESGVSSIAFDDTPRPEALHDSVFRDAFLTWLQDFQTLPPESQWTCIAPVGTDFQKSVWQTLLTIPYGQQRHYKEIAEQMGHPGASRAVGSAIASNPIALLIPCHRVVPASGGFGNYRWGTDRKCALLQAEQIQGSDMHQLFL
jgi:O-6-methylguanine DNA methyltransferase